MTLSAVRDVFEAWGDEALEYCEGRSPWARAGLAAYLVYAGARHVANPLYRSWFAGITLAFHEMGHVLFSGFGRTWMFLGGSLMQLLVPLAAGAYLLLRQRDWFGVAVTQSWLAFSLWELATYVGDANKEQLALVSLGGNPEHDWSTLLTQWHCLNACDAYATLLRVVAFVTWSTAIALAVALLVRMEQARRASGA